MNLKHSMKFQGQILVIISSKEKSQNVQNF